MTKVVTDRFHVSLIADVDVLFNGYNPSIHPGIFHEFQSAAMRFGHTLITPGLWRR